jgi:hypothetical protein
MSFLVSVPYTNNDINNDIVLLQSSLVSVPYANNDTNNDVVLLQSSMVSVHYANNAYANNDIVLLQTSMVSVPYANNDTNNNDMLVLPFFLLLSCNGCSCNCVWWFPSCAVQRTRLDMGDFLRPLCGSVPLMLTTIYPVCTRFCPIVIITSSRHHCPKHPCFYQI